MLSMRDAMARLGRKMRAVLGRARLLSAKDSAQLGALLRKQILLKRRRPIPTICELALPLAFALLLAYVRSEYDDCCKGNVGPYLFYSAPVYPAYRMVKWPKSIAEYQVTNTQFQDEQEEAGSPVDDRGLIYCGNKMYAETCARCMEIPDSTDQGDKEKFCGGDCIFRNRQCVLYDDVADRDDWTSNALIPVCMVTIRHYSSHYIRGLFGKDPLDNLLSPLEHIKWISVKKFVTAVEKTMAVSDDAQSRDLRTTMKTVMKELDMNLEDFKKGIEEALGVDMENAVQWFNDYAWEDVRVGDVESLWDKMKDIKIDQSLPNWLVDTLKKNKLPTTVQGLLDNVPDDVQKKMKLPDISDMTWGELVDTMYTNWKDDDQFKDAETKIEDLVGQSKDIMNIMGDMLAQGQGVLTFLEDLVVDDVKTLDDLEAELEKLDKKEAAAMLKDLRKKVLDASETIQTHLAQTHDSAKIVDELTSEHTDADDYARQVVTALQNAEVDVVRVITRLLTHGEDNAEKWLETFEKELKDVKYEEKTDTEKLLDFVNKHGIPKIAMMGFKTVVFGAVKFARKAREGAQWARIEETLEKAVTKVDSDKLATRVAANVNVDETKATELKEWLLKELEVIAAGNRTMSNTATKLISELRETDTVEMMHARVKAAVDKMEDGADKNVDMYWGKILHTWRKEQLVHSVESALSTGLKKILTVSRVLLSVTEDDEVNILQHFDGVVEMLGNYASEDTMAWFGKPSNGHPSKASSMVSDAIDSMRMDMAGWQDWFDAAIDELSEKKIDPPSWVENVAEARRLRRRSDNSVADELKGRLWRKCMEVQKYMTRRLDEVAQRSDDEDDEEDEEDDNILALTKPFFGYLHEYFRPATRMFKRRLQASRNPAEPRVNELATGDTGSRNASLDVDYGLFSELEVENVWSAEVMESYAVLEWAMRELEWKMKELKSAADSESTEKAEIKKNFAAVKAKYASLNDEIQSESWDLANYQTKVDDRLQRDRELSKWLGKAGMLDSASVVFERADTAEDELTIELDVRKKAAKYLAEQDTTSMAYRFSNLTTSITRKNVGNTLFVVPDTSNTRRLMEDLSVELSNSLFGAHKMPTPLNGMLTYFVHRAFTPLITYASTEQIAIDRFVSDPTSVRGVVAFDLNPSQNHYAASFRTHASFFSSTKKIFSRYGGRLGLPRIGKTPYQRYFMNHVQDSSYRAFHRMHARHLESTKANRAHDGNCTDARCLSPGLLNARANKWVDASNKNKLTLERMPSQRMEKDYFIYAISSLLPMMMVLSWLYSVSLITKDMVYEKERCLRVVLHINGLSPHIYWLGNLIFSTMLLSIGSVMIAFILIAGNVLRYTDCSLLLVFFLLYSIAAVSFANLMSAFFTRAKVASAVTGLCYYVMYLPYTLYDFYEHALPFSSKCGYSLFSSTALGIGSRIISEFELQHTPLDWTTFAGTIPLNGRAGGQRDNTFNLAHVMAMLVVDIVLYQLLAWYVEQLFPGTYGVGKRWFFPLAYLRRWYRGESEDNELVASVRGTEIDTRFECFERATDDRNIAVSMQGLHKIYPNKFLAVNNLSLDLHRGQIVGLLGPNGAGKSTTIALLTGLYAPTKGKIVWQPNGDGKGGTAKKSCIGVCLQQNALYEELTVEEHLRLFGVMKGVIGKDALNVLVEKALNEISQLRVKRHHAVKRLSGGMKRKLCLALALCAESEVVVLDEPTSGIDAKSRRDIWDILIAARNDNRAMLLSTHYMEEADALSTRVGFIMDGTLKALASPLTLKKHYTTGYTLTLFLTDKSANSVESVMEHVTAICPGAKLKNHCGGLELACVLPERDRGNFARLFTSLGEEKTRAQLRVESFSLTAASLEEVFVNATLGTQVRFDLPDNISTDAGDSETASTVTGVRYDELETMSTPTTITDSTTTGEIFSENASNSKETKKNHREDASKKYDCDLDSLNNNSITTASTRGTRTSKNMDIGTAPALRFRMDNEPSTPLRFPWMTKVGALMLKRQLSVRRDRKAWMSQILLPALFVMIALLFASLRPLDENLPKLQFTSRMFDELTIPMHHVYTDEKSSDIAGMNGDIVNPIGEGNYMGSYIYENRSSVVKNSFIALSEEEPGHHVLWYHCRGFHAEPAAIDMMAQIRGKRMWPEETPTVETYLHPLPKTVSVMAEEMFSNKQVLTDTMVAITLMLAMAFIPASFVLSVVHERHTRQKHLQMLSGVSTLQYWVSCYWWDLLNFLASLVLIVIIFLAFEIETYTAATNIFAVASVMVLYATTMTPLMYLLSFLFHIPATAYTTLICVNIFTGSVSTLAVVVLGIYSQYALSLRSAYEVTSVLFPWILPNFCLGRSVMLIAQNHYVSKLHEMAGVPMEGGSPFAWEVCGKYLFSLAVMAPVWFSLVLFVDSRRFGWMRRWSQKGIAAQHIHSLAPKAEEDDMDEDVQKEVKESAHLAQYGTCINSEDKPGLHLKSLYRIFTLRPWWKFGRLDPTKSTLAVNNMNCVVKKGETFGLLGVNGAGKTTTIRMITGDECPTNGDAYVNGFSVVKQFSKAKKNIGYCPQFDALPDKLTCFEVTRLFSSLRGIRSDAERINDNLARMNLSAFANTKVDILSGGNRRKLSTLVALINSPSVVLLDEPSCGVDVMSRRFLWDILASERAKGKALLLTTHSLEEAASVCTRLGIMINGKLRCVGSSEYLKAKHGSGYTLLVKTQASPETQAFFYKHLPSAKLIEEAIGFLRYQLPLACNLAKVFNLLQASLSEDYKQAHVDDYAISNTSLEDVFLKFVTDDENKAAAQVAPMDDNEIQDV
eukprot:GEMP01000174.1.p1 GENE.GEMP01000174.1~~GEMP01000174.1.p1  ORF type:complete len:2794 (+),score=654.50 GEMP01000174.1:281-8662(+)